MERQKELRNEDKQIWMENKRIRKEKMRRKEQKLEEEYTIHEQRFQEEEDVLNQIQMKQQTGCSKLNNKRTIQSSESRQEQAEVEGGKG